MKNNLICVVLWLITVSGWQMTISMAIADVPRMEIVLAQGQECRVRPGEPIGFVLRQSAIPAPGASGFQAFLNYNPSGMTFVNGQYTSQPYPVKMLSPIVPVNGDINLAAHIDFMSGTSPVTSAADLVTLQFSAGEQEGSALLTFRNSFPTSEFGGPSGAITAELINSPIVFIDGTGPLISNVVVDPPVALPGGPIKVSLTATDAAEVSSVSVNGSAMVLDNNVWTGQITASSLFGRHAIEFQSTDGLGNTSTCNNSSYTTGRKVVSVTASAFQTIMENASLRFVFEFAGAITVQDSNQFTVNDGSYVPLTVYLPEHGLTTGMWVKTAGYVQVTEFGPMLHSTSTLTSVLF